MAKFFSYSDLEKPVLLSGFKPVKSNAGSHQIYKQEETGLMITIPKHPGGVSVGVGQKVLETVVLGARMMHVNIGAKSNKLNTAVANYILSHHKKCKENLLFLIPEEVRKVKNIENPQDVRAYLLEHEHRYKKHFKAKETEYIN
jgi:predicted RNA binding protein YcfA (HicA-like mRNA interferase family)